MGEDVSHRYTPLQRGIYIGCTAAYAIAYTGRLNMSAALPGVTRALALDGGQSGMLQTVFALTYAAGQMINGTVVDHISPRRFIFVGLLASAAANLAFGLSGAYAALLICWCLNGFAQSMLWTPVVRLVAGWFSPEQRPRVSFTMSMAMIAGHLAAWAISGYMARVVSWRWSFILPAALMAAMAFVTLPMLTDPPAARDITPDMAKAKSGGGAPLSAVLFGSGLWIMLLVCVCNGFARDTVITWAPTIISGLGSLDLSSTAISLLIPVADCLGIVFIRQCQKRADNNKYIAILISMVIALAMAALMRIAGGGPEWLYPAALAILCAVMYGINPLLTMLIPMDYQSAGRVGLVAGLVDCFIYLGSSLSGVLVGVVKDAGGWNAVFALLCVATAIGGALCALASARRTKR